MNLSKKYKNPIGLNRYYKIIGFTPRGHSRTDNERAVLDIGNIVLAYHRQTKCPLAGQIIGCSESSICNINYVYRISCKYPNGETQTFSCYYELEEIKEGE